MYVATDTRPRTGSPSARGRSTRTPTTGCSHGSCDTAAAITSSYTQLYPAGDIDGEL